MNRKCDGKARAHEANLLALEATANSTFFLRAENLESEPGETALLCKRVVSRLVPNIPNKEEKRESETNRY